MKALKVQSPGKASVVSDAAKPALRPGYVLVKVVAVALNPTDWKHIGFVQENVTVGCDYSGIVEEVGSGITKQWKKGDRICGFTHGSNSSNTEDGAFGEYLVAKGDLQIKIPDNVTFEEAATLGVGIITVGQGYYKEFGLPWPSSPAKEEYTILVYGGSSATGAAAIQWAKLSGLDVVTTCSPRNFDYVKSIGASEAFDYSSDDCGKQIREYTKNKLFYAYDTIAEKTSPQICADALSTDTDSTHGKPQYCAILFPKFPRDDVTVHYTFGYEVIGEEFKKGPRTYAPKPELFEHTKKVVAEAERLLNEGKLKAHKYEVRDGGLDGILEGLDDMKNGKISGTKVVYKVSNA